MKGMSTQERYNDICRISGMSEDIVRRVLNAEKTSISNSLKRGERATLIGRVTIRPELRTKVEIGGAVKHYVKLKSEVSNALEADFLDIDHFENNEVNNNSDDSGILLRQIKALI